MPLKRLLIILYICLIGLLAAATFIEQAYGTEFVERNIYHTIWFCCLWGVIAAIGLLPSSDVPYGGDFPFCCFMAPSSLSWWGP